MSNPVSDYLVFLVPLAVAIYTSSYGVWLWNKKRRGSALGVMFVALITVIYSGVVLFIVHK